MSATVAMASKIARRAAAAMAAAGVAAWLLCLSGGLFRDVSYSTVVTDRNGELLGARVADDGQWRFPPCDTLPEKFVTALVEFEDRSFYLHPGVNPLALARAAVQNVRAGRVVSGGSTISMQVIRLSRRRERTLAQKAVEMLMAMRMELTYSKREILSLYAAHAPFGGNVVGLQAAMWRYFGTDGADLSWAEAATLAVMQNAPSSVTLTRRRDALLAKRNRLLARLRDHGKLSADDYALAVEEPLLAWPQPMNRHASHLVEWYDRTRHGQATATAIDLRLQRQVEAATADWARELRQRGVNDLAAVVVDVAAGTVVAYCGNSDMAYARHGQWVDIARRPRSSGSLLKPLLYAAALQQGVALPQMLLPDVPTDFGGFAPKNFDGGYRGAVAADQALALSLNVPNVALLRDFGVPRFVDVLRRQGFTTLTRPAASYGLSLTLGGGEVTLLDAVGCYAALAGVYTGERPPASAAIADRVAIYCTLEAMRQVDRPDQMDWRRAVSVQNVAWKTGTSYGSRDAWAVGVTPRYAVGVWAGNADGSGVSGMTGASVAGPVMFDLFNLLPRCEWFDAPVEADGVRLSVCRHSGHLAGRDCPEVVEQLLPRRAAASRPCPYCQLVAVANAASPALAGGDNEAAESGSRVNFSGGRVMEKRFLLPPAMAQYYRAPAATATLAPDSHADAPVGIAAQDASVGIAAQDAPVGMAAQDASVGMAMQFEIVYPTEGCIIAVPRLLDGSRGSITARVAATSPAVAPPSIAPGGGKPGSSSGSGKPGSSSGKGEPASGELFWHLDGEYLGATADVHAMQLSPSRGRHRLTVVSSSGRTHSVAFSVR